MDYLKFLEKDQSKRTAAEVMQRWKRDGNRILLRETLRACGCAAVAAGALFAFRAVFNLQREQWPWAWNYDTEELRR